MQDYMGALSKFTPIDNGEYIKLNTNVLFENSFCRVTLHIYIDEKGYTIVHEDEGFFYHCSYNNPEYYYKRFTEEDKTHCHFNIQFIEGKFYKDYAYDFNILVAVNEFVRYFIYLDDFISTIE